MEIPVKILKSVLAKVSKGLITDADYFFNYNNTVYPDLVIMIDVDWTKLPEEIVNNRNKIFPYLEDRYSDFIKSFLMSIDFNYRGRIVFDVLNWGD